MKPLCSALYESDGEAGTLRSTVDQHIVYSTKMIAFIFKDEQVDFATLLASADHLTRKIDSLCLSQDDKQVLVCRVDIAKEAIMSKISKSHDEKLEPSELVSRLNCVVEKLAGMEEYLELLDIGDQESFKVMCSGNLFDPQFLGNSTKIFIFKIYNFRTRVMSYFPEELKLRELRHFIVF